MMFLCAAPYAEQLAATTALNWVGSKYVILFRGRTVVAAPAEAETWGHAFGRNFLSCGCRAITNHAALSDEYAAPRGAGQTVRWIRARRNRPRDEHRDQGHPKNLAGTECSSPRHAHFSVPVSSIRFQATDEAKRLAERVSLPNSLNLLSLPHVAQGLNTDDWTWNKDSAKTEQAVSASLWPPSFGLNDARGPNLLDLPGPVAGQV
jgi:hypothetical protein